MVRVWPITSDVIGHTRTICCDTSSSRGPDARHTKMKKATSSSAASTTVSTCSASFRGDPARQSRLRSSDHAEKNFSVQQRHPSLVLSALRLYCVLGVFLFHFQEYSNYRWAKTGLDGKFPDFGGVWPLVILPGLMGICGYLEALSESGLGRRLAWLALFLVGAVGCSQCRGERALHDRIVRCTVCSFGEEPNEQTVQCTILSYSLCLVSRSFFQIFPPPPQVLGMTVNTVTRCDLHSLMNWMKGKPGPVLLNSNAQAQADGKNVVSVNDIIWHLWFILLLAVYTLMLRPFKWFARGKTKTPPPPLVARSKTPSLNAEVRVTPSSTKGYMFFSGSRRSIRRASTSSGGSTVSNSDIESRDRPESRRLADIESRRPLLGKDQHGPEDQDPLPEQGNGEDHDHGHLHAHGSEEDHGHLHAHGSEEDHGHLPAHGSEEDHDHDRSYAHSR